VILETRGNAIAKSFWGKAWCQNLESYSDYANRLPRGRSYVRHGAVVDLKVQPGKIVASVAGTHMYRIEIAIHPLEPSRWRDIVSACTGQIDSLVDLLQGKVPQAVLEAMVHRERGLFPAPKEIELSCSCPDWATMCKHVAATLYGVGARLDAQPELFFVLRQVEKAELVVVAASLGGRTTPTQSSQKKLDISAIESVFGIELDAAGDAAETVAQPEVAAAGPAPRQKAARRTKAVTPARTTPATGSCLAPGCDRPSRGLRSRGLCSEHGEVRDDVWIALRASYAPAPGARPRVQRRVVETISQVRKASGKGKITPPCPVPGCGHPGLGPRFHWLCQEHGSMSRSEWLALKQAAAVAPARKRK
jgi:uncharacterized Zn finger protein